MQQHAAPQSEEKNYGAQAATARGPRKTRWDTPLVATNESTRGTQAQPDAGGSSRGDRAQGYETNAREDRRARDRNSAGGSSRGDRAQGYAASAREERRPRDRNSWHEGCSRSRSPERNRSWGSHRESGRGHHQRGQEERTSNQGNRQVMCDRGEFRSSGLLGEDKEVSEDESLGFFPHAPRAPDVVDPPCLLYTSPSPRDGLLSRMPSSA